MRAKPKLAKDLFPIGAAIHKRRRELDLSQVELARRAGMNRTYISDVERGARNISLSTLQQLSAALETHAWKLIREAETKIDRTDR